jgi:hypothetical protein
MCCLLCAAAAAMVQFGALQANAAKSQGRVDVVYFLFVLTFLAQFISTLLSRLCCPQWSGQHQLLLV